MVAAGRPCDSRSTITPTEYALQILTGALRRVGCSLKGTHCKGNLAPSEASCTLISGIKGGLLALKSFQSIDGYRPAIANNSEICPLMSAKMKISLISWIVSTETDPREEGYPLLEPFPGSTPADKGSL